MPLRPAFSAPIPSGRWKISSAHDALKRVAGGQRAFVELSTEDEEHLVRRFIRLGVAASVLKRPTVNVREVREQFGLSQTDFAVRFGFETNTVQNWEQGRNPPDLAAQLLLKAIEIIIRPDVVEAALTNGVQQIG
jgi:DNA-binding transcriptional regulator YiaG